MIADSVFMDERPLLAGALAPVWLVVLLGCLVTPTVVLSFLVLHSVWLTYISLYYLWVVVPAAVCFVFLGSRQHVLAGFRRGTHRPRQQLALALPLAAAVVVSSALGYHLLARPLGIDMAIIRAKLLDFGLSPATPAGDLGTMAWLTFLNPVMEEGFWRLFVFELLRSPEHLQPTGGDGSRSSSWWQWWGPACATSAMYAAYHVPVVWQFLPRLLVPVAYCLLVGLGMMLQLLVARFGLVLACGVHLAYDATACVILADALWGLGLYRRA